MNAPIAAGSFTALMWDDISVIRREILNTGFIKKLADGTLGEDEFLNYIMQDIVYLAQDTEALKTLAERSPEEKYGSFFMKLAEDGIISEKIMHDEYLPDIKIPGNFSQSPAFEQYGKFLLKHAADSPFEVAAAALLPCFWVYAFTGSELKAGSIGPNRYSRFIETYAAGEFNDYVSEYIAIVEELAQQTTGVMRKLMINAFRQAAESELLIFREATAIR